MHKFSSYVSRIFGNSGAIVLKDAAIYERHVDQFAKALTEKFKTGKLSNAQLRLILEAYLPVLYEEYGSSGVVSNDSGCDEKSTSTTRRQSTFKLPPNFRRFDGAITRDAFESLTEFLMTGTLTITTSTFQQFGLLLKTYGSSLGFLKEALHQYETNYGKPSDVENCVFEHTYYDDSQFRKIFEKFPKTEESLLVSLFTETDFDKIDAPELRQSIIYHIKHGYGHFSTMEDMELCFVQAKIYSFTPIREIISDYLQLQLSFRVKPSKEMVERCAHYFDIGDTALKVQAKNYIIHHFYVIFANFSEVFLIRASKDFFVAVLGDEGLDPVFPASLVQGKVDQLFSDFPKQSQLDEDERERVCRLKSMRGDQCFIGFGGTVAIVDDRIPTYNNGDISFRLTDEVFLCSLARATIDHTKDAVRYHAVSKMPGKRVHHTVATIGSNVYIVGGLDDFSTASGTCWKFDVQSGEWKTLAPMKERRGFHQMVGTRNRLYVFGGITPSGYSATVECYDTETDTWEYCSRMPDKRYKHAACMIGDDIIGVSGGECPSVKCDETGTVSFWTYNIDLNKWTVQKSLESLRACHSMIHVNESVFTMGGKKTRLPIERFPFPVKKVLAPKPDVPSACIEKLAMDEQSNKLGPRTSVESRKSVDSLGKHSTVSSKAAIPDLSETLIDVSAPNDDFPSASSGEENTEPEKPPPPEYSEIDPATPAGDELEQTSDEKTKETGQLIDVTTENEENKASEDEKQKEESDAIPSEKPAVEETKPEEETAQIEKPIPVDDKPKIENTAPVEKPALLEKPAPKKAPVEKPALVEKPAPKKAPERPKEPPKPKQPEVVWEQLQEMPTKRFCADVHESKGKIYLFGGLFGDSDDTSHQNVAVYNLETEQWEKSFEFDRAIVTCRFAKVNVPPSYWANKFLG